MIAKNNSMNQAHLHLLLTHLPIVGVLVGLLTLLGGYLFRSPGVKRTALGIFVFAALTAIPTFLTGEGAEEVVEDLAGVSENLIGRHEQVATVFLWLSAALGLLSLATLLADLRNLKFAKALYLTALLLATASTGAATLAGLTGGEIRHTEIRGAAAAGGEQARQEAGGARLQEDEDDEN